MDLEITALEARTITNDQLVAMLTDGWQFNPPGFLLAVRIPRPPMIPTPPDPDTREFPPEEDAPEDVTQETLPENVLPLKKKIA